MKKYTNKNRKAFSLVELVIVILIIAVLAVAVFAGGSKTIRKSQVSRAVSDLHNFSIAVETVLNENPNVANITATTDYDDTTNDAVVTALNKLLAADYQLTSGHANANTTNITETTGTKGVVFESAKTDPWGNHYYVIFDSQDLHGAKHSDFYITVLSAGPDAKTALCGAIGTDDIFMLAQYTDGDVTSTTYDMSAVANLSKVANADKLTTTTLEKDGSLYSGGTETPADSGLYPTRPVNF